MRTADYARYSSDNQREASIEDQQREISRLAERYELPQPRHFSDSGITGERRDRPGYVALLAAAKAREFDVLLLYNLKRLSRAEDLPQVLAQLRFWRIRVISCDGYDSAEEGSDIRGWIDALMGNQHNRELARQTHRGQMGQALKGFIAGGLPYGYRAVDAGDGKKRQIHADEAPWVVWIFEKFAIAKWSPLQIALELNRLGVRTQRGTTWTGSALYGDRRGLGILANPVYVGRCVWNRSKWVKDPTTGRRKRQERPKEEWVETVDEGLRIVSDDLWNAAQQRQREIRQRTAAVREEHGGEISVRSGRPPRYLFSGLLRCGVCGTRMSLMGARQYGCPAARRRGTCSNRLTVSRLLVEDRLLEQIKRDLLSEAAWKFFESELREAIKEAKDAPAETRDRLKRAERERDNIMAAIKLGIVTPTTKAELELAERRVDEAKADLVDEDAVQPSRILPKARETWRRMVMAIEQIDDVEAAREALKQILGDRIPLTPENGVMVAEIGGERSQINVVAGARYATYVLQPQRITLTAKGAHSTRPRPRASTAALSLVASK